MKGEARPIVSNRGGCPLRRGTINICTQALGRCGMGSMQLDVLRLPARLRSSPMFPFHTWLPMQRRSAERRFGGRSGICGSSEPTVSSASIADVPEGVGGSKLLRTLRRAQCKVVPQSRHNLRPLARCTSREARRRRKEVGRLIFVSAMGIVVVRAVALNPKA